MNHPSHKKQIVALRRIEGQVRGLQRMIEEGRYCVDILTQISSVSAALLRVQDKILEAHIRGCVAATFKKRSEQERQEKIEEIFHLLKQFRRIT